MQFALLIGIAVVMQCLHYYPQLPAYVASNFGGEGKPGAWSSKDGLFMIYLGMLAMCAGVFFLMPRFMPRFSTKRFNMPNREYWLAPERREATLKYIQTQIEWFGVATLLFSTAVMELVFRANLASTVRLSDYSLHVLIAYFAYSLGWIFLFINRLRVTPNE